MKIRLYKGKGGLLPFDDEAAATIRKWNVRDFLELEIKRPRNYKFHKKLFSLLKIVHENNEDTKSIDDLLNYVKIETGHADIIELRGIAFRVPRTISFSNMDEDEFSLFYDKAVDVCMKIIPESRAEIAEQIARF